MTMTNEAAQPIDIKESQHGTLSNYRFAKDD